MRRDIIALVPISARLRQNSVSISNSRWKSCWPANTSHDLKNWTQDSNTRCCSMTRRPNWKMAPTQRKPPHMMRTTPPDQPLPKPLQIVSFKPIPPGWIDPFSAYLSGEELVRCLNHNPQLPFPKVFKSQSQEKRIQGKIFGATVSLLRQIVKMFLDSYFLLPSNFLK
jgi:hypothetical protein